jgi:thioredoxin 1
MISPIVPFRSLRIPTPAKNKRGSQSLITLNTENPMGEKIVHVTDGSFESDVLGADVPVLVDFWAAWCGPCKMIAPLLDQVSEEFDGKVKVCKVDVDANPQTAAKFSVRGIPTLMLFKDGELEATKVGALSKSQLTDFINNNL